MAQQVAVGPEFQVNDHTTGDQRFAAVATAADGGLVVVWHGLGSSGNDVSSYSIQAKHYDGAGAAPGAELQVNTYTSSTQARPAVATAADGDFVVVWESLGSSGSDDSAFSLQGQRYDASGAPLGAEFQVNTYITGNQLYGAVAAAPSGDFVVVWMSAGSSGGDDSGYSLQGQRYDASGAPLGAEFQVNTYTTADQSHPAVETDADGDFVVVWHSLGSSGSDESSISVQGQRYDASGAPLGAQFQINTYTTGIQAQPAVAAAPGGDFVVVWQSYGSSGSDDSAFSVQARRYDALGAPLGAELQVNTYTPYAQGSPALAVDSDGDFVVVWQSYGSSGSDVSYSIQARRYDASGAPREAELQVNTYTTGFQLSPAVAVDSDGDFVVVWNSFGSSGGDDSAFSVQAQRYRITGDLGRRVFFDLDFDGLQESGEPGLGNVPVHLFDPLGTLVDSTLTDADGLYHFRAKAGDYYLEFELPSDHSFTPQDRGFDDTLDSDAEVASGETDTFTVLAAGDHTHWDAGMANGIGDRAWLDRNGNALQDGSEPGLAGVGVELLGDLGGAPLAGTTTDGDGRYSFPGLAPGFYNLRFIPPPAYALVPRDVGNDDRSDSDVDPLTGFTDRIVFVGGSIDRSWDAGLEPALLGDRVWLDRNGNGLQDVAEPGLPGITEPGVPGVAVRLLDGGVAELETAITGADGRYAFVGLAAGSYVLEFVLPPGYAFAPLHQGLDVLRDSDADPASGRTGLIAYTPGAGASSFDAGLLEVSFFADGFESGDTGAWSKTVP